MQWSEKCWIDANEKSLFACEPSNSERKKKNFFYANAKNKEKKKHKNIAAHIHEMNEKRIGIETENVLTVSWEWNRKYECEH